MPRRLPPLNALRAFEAAARHLSFLKAAEELHVTPGAISQQVKALEDHLAIKLFRRQPRGVLLTDAGQRYGKRMGELLDQIAAATSDLTRQSDGSVLTVTTMPSFAARWLIPRLGAFGRLHPEIAIRTLADDKLATFIDDGVDLAIRFGGGKYPGLVADFLFREEVFPVCSPRLLEGPTPLRTLDDLARHILLHDEPHPGLHELEWGAWLATQGVRHIDAHQGPRFTYTHMSLTAAAMGQGVALGTSVLCADDLESGRLIRPFPHKVAADFAYYLVFPPVALDRPLVVAFRQWLLEASAAFSLSAAA
ncbi:LysR family transcriptional regulator [Aliidongia dinghuensis]|uniref:LysR family transcriptional regulator n=1 Tax=Aliidongia dinghuensis TaxID=1867774 RepID=A0A8J2YTP3_9PROT|nr:transcriptional regulator GcvA [Aliidongia dinghuensis]GGF16618.1 LysR family transcriptional regulator [Aliidongia dinghuensis]